MKRNVFFSTALLLIISLIAVSCAPAQMQDSADSDTIQVYFGNLEAKDIDETAYTPTGTTSGGASEVKIGDVNSYYWSYKATKNDSLFSQGQTDGFVNCADETGLGNAKTFSKGKWLFELRAYASDADRKAGTQYLFSGTNESITTNNKDTVLSSSTTISIPVTYSYIAGTGTASFNYTVTIEQDTLTGHKTYEITGVNAIIDSEKKVELSDSDKDGVWTGKQAGLASGIKTIGIEVFVDNETTARASKTDLTTAIILHGLTTEITGAANVSLAGAQMTISFSSTLSGTTGQNPGQPTEDAFKTKVSSTVKAGDTLELGKYPATYTDSSGESVSAGNYVGKPVTWKVLAVENNKALVISENVLTYMKHQTDSSAYTWSGSAIRTWLNDSFITEYGLSNVSIADTTHDTDLRDSTESTTDKVFLLSFSEASNTSYFANDTAREANGLSGYSVYWWLRSRGSNNSYSAANVNDDGYASTVGSSASVLDGIRPAFWIEMESGGGN